MVAQLLQKELYRGCFRRLYIFSPSAFLDDAWLPVRDYAKNVLAQDEDEDPILHDTWDERRVQQILHKHRKITELSKKAGRTNMFGAAVVIDDFADNPRVCRCSQSLHELFVRGRHAFISCWVLVQKLRALHPIIRVNATDWYVFALRSQHEIDALIEEYGGVWGKDATLRILLHATREPYSFLWINARARRPEDYFWQGFTGHRLLPRGASGTHQSGAARNASESDRSSGQRPDPSRGAR
jgi:hypothetical protein